MSDDTTEADAATAKRVLKEDQSDILFKPAKEEVEAVARNSVHNVQKLLKAHGVELSYTPSVEYTGNYFGLNHCSIAAVSAGWEYYSRDARPRLRAIATAGYLAKFGIHISELAADQIAGRALADMKERFPHGLTGSGADIKIYRPALADLRCMDEAVAHEIWHLKEKELGILDLSHFLREGTAVYVQTRVAGAEFEWGVEYSCDLKDIYRNSGFIVNEVVKGEPSPLKALLEPDKREEMKKRIDAVVTPAIEGVSVAMLLTEEAKAEERREMMASPEYECFRANPNPLTLIEAVRRKGLNLLADDLRRHDLTKCVKYYTELLK